MLNFERRLKNKEKKSIRLQYKPPNGQNKKQKCLKNLNIETFRITSILLMNLKEYANKISSLVE